MRTRRQFMGHAATAASTLALPLLAGAQPKSIKIGVLHPVTGALAYSGLQCREGALMAIEDINKSGGITGSMRIAHLGEALGLDVEVHACGPAHRHVMSAMRNTNYYELALVGPDCPNMVAALSV